MFSNPFDRQSEIDRLKAAEPSGGYQDISLIWYLTYFAISTVISITVTYYLADWLPKSLPPESPFFFVFAIFMVAGFILMQRWHKKHNQA